MYQTPRTVCDFEAYRAKVDAIISAQCGVGLDDLPDVNLMDWFEDGYSPRQSARKAIAYANGNDCD